MVDLLTCFVIRLHGISDFYIAAPFLNSTPTTLHHTRAAVLPVDSGELPVFVGRTGGEIVGIAHACPQTVTVAGG